jgi:hypothetical protein
MSLVYTMAYDITGTYISISNSGSISADLDDLDDLDDLVMNSENLKRAAGDCDEDTIKEHLIERKDLLKELYMRLVMYDSNIYSRAKSGEVYFKLMLPTRYANHWAYCTIKALIVSLHLQLQEDYIFTTYNLNRIAGKEDFEKLNLVASNGRIIPTRLDSSGSCSVILGCIDDIDESNRFKITVDAADVGSDKRLCINLAYCLKTKEGVDGLTIYVKYAEEPTTSDYEEKGSSITIEDPKQGTYYVLLLAENALGPYRLEAQVCAGFLKGCKSVDICPSGAEIRQYPQPKIVDIHVDKSEILAHEDVTLTVKVTNNGGTASWQSIAISSPDITSSDSYTILSYTTDYFETYDSGFEAGAGYGSGTKNLDCPLLEGAKKDWEQGVSGEVKVKIRPEEAGDLRIYVKSVAFGEGVWVSDPAIFGTSTRDQQNEYVKELIVNVTGNRPPNTPSIQEGLSSGYVGTLLCYYTSTTDPDGDQIKYTFDWDDGDTSETEFVASGSRLIKA